MKFISLLGFISIAYAGVISRIEHAVKKDVAKIEHVVKKDISNVVHTIQKDVGKIKQSFSIPAITASASASSLKNHPAFSLSHAQKALSVDCLSYCSTNQIELFDCVDCRGRELIMVEEPNRKASTQLVIVADPIANEIYVSYRGTIGSVSQLLSDLDTLQDKFMCKGCKVHQGFHDRFLEICNQTIDGLVDARDQFPGAKIYVSGHSSGGAIATLISLYLSLSYPHLLPYKVLPLSFGAAWRLLSEIKVTAPFPAM
jgi:hypothetical protein